MGKSIQEWTKQNLWKTALYVLYGIWSALGRHLSNFLNVVFHKFYLVHS